MLCEFGINKLNTQITEQITCAFGLVCICFLAIYFRLVLWLIQILRLGFSRQPGLLAMLSANVSSAGAGWKASRSCSILSWPDGAIGCFVMT